MQKLSKLAGFSALLAMLLPVAVSARTISGTVASISDQTIVLTNSTGANFNVDVSDAKLLRRFGSVMTVKDVEQGDKLQVSGKNADNPQTPGTELNATNVRDLSQQQRKTGFTGTVSAVTTGGFTLQVRNRPDQTVSVSDTTVFTKLGKTAALSDVVAQESVTVTGLWDSTKNTIAADKVNIIVRSATVRGFVTAVNGSTITLSKQEPTPAPAPTANTSTSTSTDNTSATTTTTTIAAPPIIWTVDASNAKLIRRFGAAMQLTDIQNADILQVTGTIIGTNITAKIVRDDSLQSHNGTFVGTVGSVSASGFTLNSKARGTQTVNVDSTTRFSPSTLTLSALTSGETVTVSGVWDRTNANVAATRVTLRMISVGKTGTLQSVSGTTLTVQVSGGATYTVDASKARVRGKGGASVDLSAFTVGDSVRFSGRMPQGTTMVSATEVRDLTLKATTQTQNNDANHNGTENNNENEHGTVTNPTPGPQAVPPSVPLTVPAQ